MLGVAARREGDCAYVKAERGADRGSRRDSMMSMCKRLDGREVWRLMFVVYIPELFDELRKLRRRSQAGQRHWKLRVQPYVLGHV